MRARLHASARAEDRAQHRETTPTSSSAAGKNLDAIQLLANVYGGQINPDVKVVVDSENYRLRHEEQLIRNAFKTAEQVRRSGRSRLLDPMNPYERRLVHTALNDFGGVSTKSEGEGLYKQIRISQQR